MQKVKHLEYEHGNNQERVQVDAQNSMKDERNYHNDNESEMRKEKGNKKEEYKRDELKNIDEIENKEKDLDTDLKDLQSHLEM